MPCRKCDESVGSHQKAQGPVVRFGSNFRKRIERITCTSTLEFAAVDRKSRISLSRQSRHCEPMDGSRTRFITMRGHGSWNETHLFKPENVDCFLGKSQVREVDGVESASEEADGRR
jgi:hypothetical protein